MSKPEACGRISQIAEELHAILRNDSPQLAKSAAALAAEAMNDLDRAALMYCTTGWWGGAGSLADFVPTDVSARRRYMQLLVQLVTVFEASGHVCQAARSWTDAYEKWLQDTQI